MSVLTKVQSYSNRPPCARGSLSKRPKIRKSTSERFETRQLVLEPAVLVEADTLKVLAGENRRPIPWELEMNASWLQREGASKNLQDPYTNDSIAR